MLALLAVTYAHPEQLVETDWVAAHAADAGVRIVDMRQNGYAEGHIPGAVYLSPVAIREAANPPTFLPTAAAFEAMMARLGIADATRVVVYDERGGIYAARLWWILNYFGHTNVALVNGGWVKWAAEKRQATAATPTVGDTRFTARPQPSWIATAADVVAAIDKPGVKIVDARTQGEIDGKDLRNIKRGGFVPSSIPVYWEELLDPQQKTFKSADELKKIYEEPRNPAVAAGDRLLPGRDARVGGPVCPASGRLRQAAQLLRRLGRMGQPRRPAAREEIASDPVC